MRSAHTGCPRQTDAQEQTGARHKNRQMRAATLGSRTAEAAINRQMARSSSTHHPQPDPGSQCQGRYIVPKALMAHRLRRWAASSSQKLSRPTVFAGGPLHRPRSSRVPPTSPVGRFIVPEALSAHRLGRCPASSSQKLSRSTVLAGVPLHSPRQRKPHSFG